MEHILFGILRGLCAGIGLHEGDRLRCRRTSVSFLVLEADDRRTVLVDQDWARFISVARCDEGGSASSAA